MSRFALRFLFLAGAVPALVAAGVGSAEAQRKPRPACGLTDLPLVVGNQWTYESFDPPSPDGEPKKKPPLNIPNPAKRVVIEVLAVEEQGGVTTVKLQETVDEVKRETELRCTSEYLDVAPDSFFFVGEPGGAHLLTMQDMARTGHTYQLNKRGSFAGPEWTEQITAKIDRQPAEGTGAKQTGGTVELLREITVGTPEQVTTPSGVHRASRVQFELSGRARVEPNPDKPLEIPAGALGALWFAPKLGVVQAYNIQGHFYQLTDTNVAR